MIEFYNPECNKTREYEVTSKRYFSVIFGVLLATPASILVSALHDLLFTEQNTLVNFTGISVCLVVIGLVLYIHINKFAKYKIARSARLQHK